jgi:PASTA domain
MTTPTGAVAGNAAAAQREAAARPQGGSFFSRKYGPLPGWGWSLLAAGGALAFFWWRSRSAANAASAATTTPTADTTTADTADQLASLQDEIDALQGELATDTTGTTTSTGSGTGSGTGTGTGSGTGTGVQVTVPKVVGMRATPAIAKLKSAGFKAHLSTPRKAGVALKVNSQTPAAGKKAAVGSTVDLGVEKV